MKKETFIIFEKDEVRKNLQKVEKRRAIMIEEKVTSYDELRDRQKKLDSIIRKINYKKFKTIPAIIIERRSEVIKW